MKNYIRTYYRSVNKTLVENEFIRVMFNVSLAISILFEVWCIATAYWTWDKGVYSVWFAYGVPNVIYSLLIGYCLTTRYAAPASVIFTMSLFRIYVTSESGMTMKYIYFDSIVCLLMLLMILLAVMEQLNSLNRIEFDRKGRD